VSNRLSKTDSITGATTYNYNAGDRLTTETNGSNVTVYAYDKNGNTLSQTKNANDKITYTWDYENRMKSANVVTPTGTKQASYRYDASGIRVSQTVDGVETKYLIDANRPYAQVLEEYNGSGVQASYVYGNDLISQSRNGSKSFYLEDGHSGVRQLANSSGSVTDSYNYDAYGTLLRSSGSTSNSYLYRGEQFDKGLNQYYLRAREYNPSLGRLSSVDPLEGNPMEPMSRHRYLYGNANPVSFSDPSGMFSLAELTVVDLIASIQIGSIIQGLVGNYVTKTSGNVSWEGIIGTFNASLYPISSSLPSLLGLSFSGSISAVEAFSEVVGNSQAEGKWLLFQIGYSFGFSGIPVGGSISSFTKLTSPRLFYDVYGGGLGGFVTSGSGSLFTFPFSNQSLSSPLYPNALGLIMGYGYGYSIGGGAGLSIGIDLQAGVSIPVAYDQRLRNRTPN
jgi:RHS repeat-associated protein